jgi:Methylase involved in ubiquinone/menaquinone biosynthesis
MAINEEKLHAFVGKMVEEAGAVFTAPLILLGDRLGLFKAMAGAGALLPDELAAKTQTDERYVREWLCAMAASGYAEYDPATGAFTLPDEQAMVLAWEDSPVFLAGMFDMLEGVVRGLHNNEIAFRTGGGIGWGDHHACVCHGVARFFRTAYAANLTGNWIPALDGVEAALRAGGAKVADVGCGHGWSTVLMAQAFPEAEFTGFDFHEPSVQQARERAAEAGLDAGRVRFETASAKSYPGTGYDLVTMFDALHDMGDPVGAARHVRETLAPDGVLMIVEPFANDRVEDNLTPMGRLGYASSTLICTPTSKAQEVGLALGAQAGQARLRAVLEEAGFTRIRCAVQTPFNLILEARP